MTIISFIILSIMFSTALLTIISMTIQDILTLRKQKSQRKLKGRRTSVQTVIKPLPAPSTLHQLFLNYRHITSAPFESVRQVLGVEYYNRRLRTTRRGTLYAIARWISASANAITFGYICYVAVVLYRPIYLQAYLLCFSSWIILSTWRYPYLSTKQRLTYTFLAPVAYGYFALLALYAPFTPLVQRVRAAIAGHVYRSARQPSA